MKKKFRGAAGQGQKGQSTKQSDKQNEGSGQKSKTSVKRSGNRMQVDDDNARQAGGGKKTGRRRFDEASSENDSPSDRRSAGSSGGKSRPKKQIRNARSLSEVLGVATRTPSAATPRSNFRPPRGGPAESSEKNRTSHPTSRSGFAPPKASVPEEPAAKPKISKLKYIMNFFSPPAKEPVAPPVKAPPARSGPTPNARSSSQSSSLRSSKSSSPASASSSSSASGSRASQRDNQRETERGSSTRRGAGGRDKPRGRGRNDEQMRAVKDEPSSGRRGSRSTEATSIAARSTDRNADQSGDRSSDRSSDVGTGRSGRIGAKGQGRVGAGQSQLGERASQNSRGRKEKSRSSSDTNPRVEGFVKRHPDGYGFLIPDDRTLPDVYISRQWMTGVMTNDRVEAEIYQNRHDKESDRLFGEIKEILTHATKRVVGKYLPVDRRYGVILDEDHGWGADLRIPTQDAMNAIEGDMVAVEIVQYPGPDQEFLGKVIERIGDLENPLNDVKRVIYTKNIPDEFSAKALADARRYGGEVTEMEIKGRDDLRKLNLITIDGATARDFDDAIFVEKNARGFHLIVAIADVSHYVKPGTTLDEEAYERGTSTYFPNYVVPMLPEELSNELCSLKPHVTRLCFVCDMQINHEGTVESSRFFEGVMESKARVTYGEAQEVIDGNTPGKLAHVKENILIARDLAKILMAKRFRDGSLDLEIPETQVVVDKSGETTDIIRSERLFAHRLIEELMLVTNICTAKFFDANNIEGIYRVHEEPNAYNIETLQKYLYNFGGQASLGEGKLQKKLTKALESMHGKPGAQVLNILTLRSMNQAKYSANNVGHFGLGFDHYSHFTSPIRRYPDLMAHRQIKSVLYPKYRSLQMSEEDLQSAATMLSGCEQRSVKAERQLIAIKKARFMKKYVGEEFVGMISSVAKFGIFVLLRQFDVDGLVKIESLGNDRFIYDEENLRLVGKRNGMAFTIGDEVRILVASADTEFGKIDFQLAKSSAPAGSDTAGGDDEIESEDGSVERGGSRGEQLPRSKKRGSNRERAQKTESKRGGKSSPQQLGGTNEQASQPGSVGKEGHHPKRAKDGGDAEKRGPTENNRRGVRKERVSKSRGKN